MSKIKHGGKTLTLEHYEAKDSHDGEYMGLIVDGRGKVVEFFLDRDEAVNRWNELKAETKKEGKRVK